MHNSFWVRFVIAFVGGAVAGLLIGVIGKYAFDTSWSIVASMAWGVMAGCLLLAFGYATKASWRKPSSSS